MSLETDYISYLEERLNFLSWRVGQLEATLLYVLTVNDRPEPKDLVYTRASCELWKDVTMGLEMKTHFKRLTNG